MAYSRLEKGRAEGLCSQAHSRQARAVENPAPQSLARRGRGPVGHPLHLPASLKLCCHWFSLEPRPGS